MSPESKKLFNIIILGVSFMFIFTAFQTCGNIAQTVITNLNNTDFHGSGYTSMSIIYGVFSASNLISPSVVAIVGPQLSMVVSGIFYSLYIAVFIQPATWAFYTASVFIGIAAAVLWTAQGNCLTVNSDENTIGRNSGLFWALLQSSLFFGNLYIYFAWQGKTHISESDRRTVFIALTVISLVGTVLFFLIRKQEDTKAPGEEDSANEILGDSSSAQNKMMRALAAFKKSIKLSFTKEIMLLSVTTAYTGLELTFFSGVYGTCIGAVNRFGSEEKSLIGLSGIFIGVGEILGGGIFGLLSKNNRFGRNPVVMLGIIVHFVAFYLIFFNMPNDAPIAPMEGTDRVAYMIPSKEVAIFCSFLLGLGDSCFNTQLLSILGFLYSEDSAPAFAIFKFVQVKICVDQQYQYHCFSTAVQSIETVHAWSHQQQASAGSRGQSVSSLKDDSCLLQKDSFFLMHCSIFTSFSVIVHLCCSCIFLQQLHPSSVATPDHGGRRLLWNNYLLYSGVGSSSSSCCPWLGLQQHLM